MLGSPCSGASLRLASSRSCLESHAISRYLRRCSRQIEHCRGCRSGVKPVMSLEMARNLLQQSSKVAVLTGAGISAESGVPTFRGSAGLWKQFRPEDLATPEAFARDPNLVWEWYAWRRSLLANVRPNAGHCALAE